MPSPDAVVSHTPSESLRPTGRARSGAAALLVGALLVAAALTLHLRGGVEDVAFVRRIEAAPQQWLAAHVFSAVGGVLLALGLPSVLHLSRGRGGAVIRVGVILAIIGAACTALGDFAHGSLAYVLTDHADAHQSLDVQKDFFYEPAFAAVSILGNLLPLGMLVLGIGLLISRTVPAPAAILLLVSPIAIQVGFSVTALPMVAMVLPFVAAVAWIASMLFKGAA
jgi:hypothetical protein